ncbi:uncharacterized protein LOC112568700 [Pomacea canaliculata]|uniref:uncharacterized protein LOC112568700 n=1 Tax=Pomacea canaliculata TaxID=400727 RepID=UPI000D72FAAF|nr:uncharacterized protein LOC112568700 [Pomacea canaliculata]
MRTGSWIVLPFVIACFVQSTYSDSGQPNVLTTDCPKYVREGNNLSCTCQTTDNTVNPYWKEQSGSAQLVKNNVSRHDNGTVFTCAMNLDEVTVNYTLLVAYGPEKVQILGPSNFTTNGSQYMTLTCNTTGSYPEANCYWGNVRCQSPNPTPTCIFRPRGRYDEGKNISCYAFNKESDTRSAPDIFTLRLHYPPELAPHITARRKVNSTTVDIVTCSVTGGHPQVSFVNLTCDDTRNSSLSDDSPETNQTDVVFTSIVFALVGPRTVSCTCQGVWSPQQDMYQHIVNASFYFSHEKRHSPLDLLMAVIIGCLTFVALIAVCVFTAVLCKRLKTEHYQTF